MINLFDENWNCCDYNLNVTCFNSSWFSWFEQFLENSLNCHRNCNAEFFSTFPCCKEEFVTLILACTILRINRPLAWLMTYHLNSTTAKKKVNWRFYNRCSVNTHSQVQVTWIKSWLLKISKYFWETGQRNICMMTWTCEVDMVAVHMKLNYWMISNQDWK